MAQLIGMADCFNGYWRYWSLFPYCTVMPNVESADSIMWQASTCFICTSAIVGEVGVNSEVRSELTWCHITSWNTLLALKRPTSTVNSCSAWVVRIMGLSHWHHISEHREGQPIIWFYLCVWTRLDIELTSSRRQAECQNTDRRASRAIFFGRHSFFFFFCITSAVVSENLCSATLNSGGCLRVASPPLLEAVIEIQTICEQ